MSSSTTPPASSHTDVGVTGQSVCGWPLRLVRVLAWVAFTCSALLWVNELNTNLGMCRFDGCGEIQASPLGHPLGIPLPLVGLVGFGLLFMLALFPATRLWLLFKPMALTAGVAGAALATVQIAVLHHVCLWCLTIDAAAIGLAVVTSVAVPRHPPVPSRAERNLWLAVGAMGLLMPAGLSIASAPRTAPAQVRAYWRPGEVNVVEIADFACTHCRELHHRLRPALEKNANVHLTIISAAMPGHMHAREAALAFRAAVALSKGQAMAEALFAADDLSAEGCERLAQQIGLSVPAYRHRLHDPRLLARFDEDMSWIPSATPGGLPAVWVQDRFFGGQDNMDAILAAVHGAGAWPGPAGIHPQSP